MIMTFYTSGQSPSQHQHERQNQIQQKFNIQTLNCPMA
jgi:hypothetical protein